jgi:signal transduction histidine kinase
LFIDKYTDWSRITSLNKTHICLIIQEAVQNSNKYSKVGKCYIILLRTTDKITVWIWDNGEGFNPEKLVNGIGLKNIEKEPMH